MRLYRTAQGQWLIDAPAKLNLFFEVRSRRSDGYHEIETLMCPIALYDTLIFSTDSTGRIELKCTATHRADNPSLPEDRRNLVVRALELLKQRTGCPLGARLELIKRIPTESGLGGGSSDAAAALMVAAEAWGLSVAREMLINWAAELGSDVPFFLVGGPAVCRGRGEIVEPIGGGGFHFVVVRPEQGLSTAEVYRQCTLPTEHRPLEPTVAALRAGDAVGLGKRLFNRLQSAAAAISPWIDRLHRAFSQLDVCGHQMSGSGSAYFGVCRHARHARWAAMRLAAMGFPRVFTAASCL